MPRKSTETTPSRSRKTTQPVVSAAVQPTPAAAVPEVLGSASTAVVPTNSPKPIAVMPVKTSTRAASASLSSVNLDEEIRRRAYELYLQRNGQPGDPVGDWFIAEREVRARHAVAGRSA